MWIVNKENNAMINLDKFIEVGVSKIDPYSINRIYFANHDGTYTNIIFDSPEETQEVFDDLQLAIAQGDRIFYIGRE